jgi:soluble epoxide hydrolase / lipid-phosphate phosphatase
MEELKNALLEGGMEGPFCYYGTLTSDISYNDAQQPPDCLYLGSNYFFTDIKKENLALSHPTFFGGAKRDLIARVPLQVQGMEAACKEGGVELTVREFDSGHWVILEKRDEVKESIGEWLSGLGL